MENKTYENIVISILGGRIGSSANTVFNDTFTAMNGITIGVCAIIVYFVISRSKK